MKLLSRSIPVVAASLSVLSHGANAALDGHCPPLGAVLPQPTAPSKNAAVPSAAAILQKTLEEMTAKLNFSAVSLGVKSIHEDASLIEFHHTPSQLDPKGAAKVASDTVYRVGSASKVFAVLATLKAEGVDLNDPITKYLPELRELKTQALEQNDVFLVDWDSITLGALASHLSGIAADLMIDLANFPGPWTQLGLPALDNSSTMACASLSGPNPGDCTIDDFLANFGKRPPIQPAFGAPAYSNIGSPLLGFVIERVTKKKYADFVQQTILDPLGMKHTSIHIPADKKTVVIPVNNTFPENIGFESAAGAYYSTLTDILTFGNAILSHKTLSPVETRAWLKPLSATSSRGMLMGAPWEIYQAHNVTVDGRLIEIYTKSGDLFSYHANLVLIPDYDITMAVLTAGPEVSFGTVQALTAAAIRAILPAIEKAGKAQAETDYSGVYVDEKTNSTLSLSLDTAPGFKVSNFSVRGVDIAANYARLSPAGRPGPPVRVRLYPTISEAKPGLGARQVAWRAMFDAPFDAAAAAQMDAMFPWPDPTCVAWAMGDRAAYGFEGVDLMVFDVDASGKATTVKLPAWDVTLTRK